MFKRNIGDMKITVLNQRYKKHFGYPHILMGDVKVTVSAMIACAVLLHPNKLFASVAGTSLPYQTYRDFAENKGEFRLAQKMFLYMIKWQSRHDAE